MNRIMWPGIIFIILGASVIVHGVMLYVVNTDATFAVDDRYRARTDPWWEAVDRAGTERKTGWSATLEMVPSDSIEEMMRLTVRLTDRHGAAVENARVEMRLFHRGRAGEVLPATLEASGGGRYVTLLRLDPPGMWKATALITRDEQTFAESFDLFVAP